MTVQLYRVDNRLIHGQILQAWVPELGTEAIVVIDDGLVRDDFSKSILENMGQGLLEVRVVERSKAEGTINRELKGKKVIVLFRSVDEAAEARASGLRIDRLNLGNIHAKPGAKQLDKSVYLTPDEAMTLIGMAQHGVALEARAVPSDRSPDVVTLCRELSGGL